MARNYQAEAIQKFPVTAAPPLKDNYTDNATYQWDSEEFQRQHAAVVSCQRVWIACQEAEDQHHQAKAERAAEQLKTQKAAEAAAACKHAWVANGKHPKILLPTCGDASSTGPERAGAKSVVVG